MTRFDSFNDQEVARLHFAMIAVYRWKARKSPMTSQLLQELEEEYMTRRAEQEEEIEELMTRRSR